MTTRLELPVAGMTCASCAVRVERSLNRLDGVEATVNYATERATVTYDPHAVSEQRLAAAVEAAGYHALLPTHPEPPPAADDGRRRLVAAAALSVPVAAIAMLPPLQYTGWEWVAFALTTPVVLWAGLPFHRAAWRALRHGTATMDTLVSVGTLSAWAWSAAELVRGDGELYFEVAAVVTTLILAGRYLEGRAKRRAGAALRALLELGAKNVTVVEDGRRRQVPVGELVPGREFLVMPGEKVATDGVVVEGHSAIDRSLLTGEATPLEVGPWRHRDRRNGQRRWNADRARDGRRRRHLPGPDLGARHRGAVGQGGRAAAGRPGFGRVRPDRDPAGRRHLRRVDADRLVCIVRVRGRGSRADRGVPVRARPGHTDGAARRHRPGSTAGRADPRPRGARADPPGDRCPARQDGDSDPGQDDRPRGAGERGGRDRAAAARRRRRRRERPPGVERDRRTRPSAAGRAAERGRRARHPRRRSPGHCGRPHRRDPPGRRGHRDPRRRRARGRDRRRRRGQADQPRGGRRAPRRSA